MMSLLLAAMLNQPQAGPHPQRACSAPSGSDACSEVLGVRVVRTQEGSHQLLNELGVSIGSGSQECCEQQRLAYLIDRYGTGRHNWRFPTLGGMQWWADEHIHAGWRIQRHVRTGHWRLLDDKDVRQAWGSYEACCTVLERERMKQSLTFASRHLVLMLPGLGRSKDMFRSVMAHLVTNDCAVMAINYPSTRLSLEEHSKQLARVLTSLRDIDTVTLVGHSMGGLVIRGLFDRDQEPASDVPMPAIRQCILVFTPNQGAYKADLWSRRWWYRCILGPAAQALRSDRVQAVPLPTVPTVVIAGGKGDGHGRSRIIPGDDDGTVAVAETVLPGAEQYIFSVGHTFGVNDQRVIATIEKYIRSD